VDNLRPEARGPPQEGDRGRSPHLPPSNAAFECIRDFNQSPDAVTNIVLVIMSQTIPSSFLPIINSLVSPPLEGMDTEILKAEFNESVK
jgi:hypothetical protein